MADSKITALTNLTAADPVNDMLPIVDVSDTIMAASGTTKRISVNNILSSSPTASGALTVTGLVTAGSATITGDLTVASNILKVTGGNVGINTASATNTSGYKTLEIVGTGVNTGGMIRMKSSDASVNSLDFLDNNGRGIFAVSNHNLRFGCNDIEQYRIQPLGIFTWYDGAGGTRMTLNSTGLGIGRSPIAKLNVDKASQTPGGTTPNGAFVITDNVASNLALEFGVNSASFPYIQSRNSTSATYYDLLINPNGGNVGVGVTPSAWSATFRSLDIGSGTLTSQASQQTIGLFANAFENGTNYTRKALGTAAGYSIYNGAHYWLNAVSGAAASTFSFGDAKMTLDASGNLLVGTTSLVFGSASGSLNIAAANTQQLVIRNTGATAGNFWRQAVDSGNTFYVLNHSSTGVSIASGGTSWSAVSDERLKDIIEPISNAIAKVGSLRSVIGKYKNDETNIRRSFLIAQDVQSVLPEAVDSSKPDELGLRYTEVIPLLVAAIQELTAEVNALKNA